ncbi:MAG: hypothetical protein ACC618_02410 [Patescibacteria group bacterium]
MDNTTQLPLPKLREVKIIEPERKIPQPRVSRFRNIKKFELLHRPFDLRFRGRIHKWLVQLSDIGEFKLADVLDKKNVKIVKLYFYPQKPKNNWFNQEQVLEKVSVTSKRKLRTVLVASLLKTWLRTRL